jgi:predicted protein tyrosine phosphatase
MKNIKISHISFFLPRILIFLVFIIYAIFALLTYFDYLEQYLYPLHLLQGEVQELNENILIGPYPHFDEMKRLKKETGITDVISLLNVNLPQERALQMREEKIAKRLGINLYSFPMSYLGINSESNRRAVDNLVTLVKRLKDKKIYIHCYLGRHRINVVKNSLYQAGLINEHLAKKGQ